MSGILAAAGGGGRKWLVGGTFNNLTSSPGTTAYAGYQINSTGIEQGSTADGSLAWSTLGTWLPTGGDPTDYYVRATLNSGSLAAGSSSTGSWLQLLVERFWFVADAVGGIPQSADLTIELSNSATGTPVLATVSVTMYAEQGV